MTDDVAERIRVGLHDAAEGIAVQVPPLQMAPRRNPRSRWAVAAVAALVFSAMAVVFAARPSPTGMPLISIASVRPPAGVTGVQWRLATVLQGTEPVRSATDLSFHVDPNGVVDGVSGCAWLKAQFSVSDGQMFIGWWSQRVHHCPPVPGATTSATVVDVPAVLSSTSSTMSLRDGSVILTAGELTLVFDDAGPAFADQFPTGTASTATSSLSVSSTS